MDKSTVKEVREAYERAQLEALCKVEKNSILVLKSRSEVSAADLAHIRNFFEQRLGFSPLLVALSPDDSLESVKQVGAEGVLADLVRRVEALENRGHHAPPPIVGH